MAHQIVIERHQIGDRFVYQDQEVLVCGKSLDNRMLFARRWGKSPSENITFMTNDSYLFAPTVRQLRQKQGYLHDEYAELGVKDLYDKHRGCTVVVVACGPSMPDALEPVRRLHELHNHVVIGTNVCLQFGFRDVIDYYMLLCWLSQPWWWRNADPRGLKCITSFHTPPEVIRDFPVRYYFEDSFLDVTIDAPEHRKKWGTLDGGMTVVYSAMHPGF